MRSVNGRLSIIGDLEMKKGRRKTGGPLSLPEEVRFSRSRARAAGVAADCQPQCLLQAVVDRAEGGFQAGLDVRHDGNESEASRRSNEAIFDGRRTRLILHKIYELLHVTLL